jgi:hypothetical protein
MQPLAESWDVVEVMRSLVTEVDSLQKIVAGQEARVRVLERPAAPRPLIQVGDLVPPPHTCTAAAPAAQVRCQVAGGFIAESDPSGVSVAAPKAARVGKK